MKLPLGSHLSHGTEAWSLSGRHHLPESDKEAPDPFVSVEKQTVTDGGQAQDKALSLMDFKNTGALKHASKTGYDIGPSNKKKLASLEKKLNAIAEDHEIRASNRLLFQYIKVQIKRIKGEVLEKNDTEKLILIPRTIGQLFIDCENKTHKGLDLSFVSFESLRDKDKDLRNHLDSGHISNIYRAYRKAPLWKSGKDCKSLKKLIGKAGRGK